MRTRDAAIQDHQVRLPPVADPGARLGAGGGGG